MKLRKSLSCLLAVSIILASLAGCASKDVVETYTGTGNGFGGHVIVTIETKNGVITSAVAEGKDETTGIGSNAIDAFNSGNLGALKDKSISERIYIDALSGATVTSNALKTALKDIEKQAGLVTEKTALNAGTYKETVYGNNYSRPFTVEVTLTEDTIAGITVTDTAGETPDIISTAIDNLIPRIIENQSLAVDSIAGATASSGGIKTAVINAINEAGGDSAEWYTAVRKSEETVTIDGYDVVVVGLGGTGVSAFLSASDAGVKVIGIDVAAKVGGTSTTIGGPMVINPATPAMQPAEGTPGYPINVVEFRNIWMNDTLGEAKEECIDDMLLYSGETADWLVENHGFVFGPVANFMINPYIVYASYQTFENSITEMYTYAMDKACEGTENKYMLETKGTEILTDDSGAVCGVKAVSYDGTTYIISAKSVILCTGGFGGSAEMTKEYTGTVMNLYGMYQNDGTMLKYAIDNLNAGTYNMSTAGIAHAARTTVDLKNSEIIPSHQKVLDAIADSTNVIHIGVDGTRFCVADRTEEITESAYKAGDYYWSIVSDEYIEDIRVNGLDQVYMMLNVQDDSLPISVIMGFGELDPATAPFILNVGDPITDIDKIIEVGKSMGIVVEADSIEELAKATGADKLVETITNYNGYAKTGVDPEFNKSAENMKEIKGSKFYAIKGTSYCYTTSGGLNVNANTEVLDTNGNVIPGLYAAGTDSMGVLLSESVGYIDYGGIAHGWCLTSGKIAGENAAKFEG